MHHTAAWFEDFGAVSVDQAVAALQDGVLTIRSTDFFFFDEPLAALYVGIYGADMENARLNSPTIRSVTQPYLLPVGNAVIPPTRPLIADLTRNPFRLKAQENISLEVTEDTVAGSNITGVIGLRTRKTPAPPGDIWTIRGTSAGPAVANAWTNAGVITWTNDLPPGRYAVVGGASFSTTMIGFRIVFTSTTGQKVRPGGIGAAREDSWIHPMFRYGRLGVWGEFDQVIFPEFEVLCNAADTAFVHYMDLIKLT